MITWTKKTMNMINKTRRRMIMGMIMVVTGVMVVVTVVERR